MLPKYIIIIILPLDHDDHNDKIHPGYWCTSTPSSAPDTFSVSGDIKDELIDLASVFIGLVMEQVVLYGRTLWEGSVPHICSHRGDVGIRLTTQ